LWFRDRVSGSGCCLLDALCFVCDLWHAPVGMCVCLSICLYLWVCVCVSLSRSLSLFCALSLALARARALSLSDRDTGCTRHTATAHRYRNPSTFSPWLQTSLHAHAPPYALPRTSIYPYTSMHNLANIRIYKDPSKKAPMCTPTHLHSSIHVHMKLNIQKRKKHLRTPAHLLSSTHMHTDLKIQEHMYIHTQPCSHTLTCTYTHVHISTPTHLCAPLILCLCI
jgi:hypothetical protein